MVSAEIYKTSRVSIFSRRQGHSDPSPPFSFSTRLSNRKSQDWHTNMKITHNTVQDCVGLNANINFGKIYVYRFDDNEEWLRNTQDSCGRD